MGSWTLILGGNDPIPSPTDVKERRRLFDPDFSSLPFVPFLYVYRNMVDIAIKAAVAAFAVVRLFCISSIMVILTYCDCDCTVLDVYRLGV